jgi:hypothetical protein
MNRPRNRTLVGVFRNLDQVTDYMKSVMDQNPDVKHRWDVGHMIDPAHAWVNHGT